MPTQEVSFLDEEVDSTTTCTVITVEVRQPYQGRLGVGLVCLQGRYIIVQRPWHGATIRISCSLCRQCDANGTMKPIR